MEKLKELLNKDKKTSNLILIVVLLVIVLIFMNYIFSSEDETKNKQVISENINNTNESVETKLANIINKISGVESTYVMVNYSSTEKIIPVYDTKEDTDTTTENDKTSTKKTVEKTVAYEGEGSNKNALLESTETASLTGAIVVVNGSISEDKKLEIKNAVAMVTNIPLHKVQVFVN